MTRHIPSEVKIILDGLEQKHELVIVYACESGSRAWGFASRDSDYDVRFLYVHTPDWYLTVDLENKRDVIELPIDGALDVSGWDLRKALALFRNSNPPLLEWIGSPIVYREPFSTAAQMRALAETYYSQTACAYHYLHMARNNFKEYLKGDAVWRKKYFYVLRPLLAIRWIEAELGVVPTEFQRLVDATVSSHELLQGIQELLVEKAAGGELDRGPRVAVINEFIESELARLDGSKFGKKPRLAPVQPLNELFQSTLEEVF
jgi:predicted nucleotidyltransferase